MPALGTSALRTVAVLLAGGVGSRIGKEIPKQLLEVSGKPIIEYTIRTFNEHPEVDEIIIMMTPGYEQRVKDLVGSGDLAKVTAVLKGGRDRPESTRKALAALGDSEAKVLFHDAVRPLVTDRLIHDCISALESYAAVTAAISTADTIIAVAEQKGTSVAEISTVLPRAQLRRVQTPQGFLLSVIKRAYAYADRDPHFSATDDCGVILKYLPEIPIGVIPGDPQNMKITEPTDLLILEKFLEISKPPRSGRQSLSCTD